MKFLKILYVQVLIGILAGGIVGYFYPDIAPTAKLISETFINMIKMIIAPIIFVTIVSGIAGAGNLKKVGRVGGKGILYFEIVSTVALVIGLFVANIVKPGADIKPATTMTTTSLSDVAHYTESAKQLDWAEFFTHIVPSNIVNAFAEGNILQVLFFSILFGVALSKTGDTGLSIARGIDKVSRVLFYMMKIIMWLAPIGAFGGMAYTLGKFGIHALIPLGKLMLSVYITMILFVFIVLNGIVRMYGFSLWKLLVYIKNELLLVLGTSSSESALPGIMQKLEEAGIKKGVVGLIIPTGYSFNLDGTAIYLSMAMLFLAQAYHINLTLVQQLTILGVLMLTSKGAAAVTGGGFIVLASTLSVTQTIPPEGLVLLIGIDRFMSEARSITNLIGNTVATVVVAASEKEIDKDVYKSIVEQT